MLYIATNNLKISLDKLFRNEANFPLFKNLNSFVYYMDAIYYMIHKKIFMVNFVVVFYSDLMAADMLTNFLHGNLVY